MFQIFFTLFIWCITAHHSHGFRRQDLRDSSQEECVDVNEGSKTVLKNLPGIGKAMVNKIVAGRPINTAEDLKLLLGDQTLEFVDVVERDQVLEVCGKSNPAIQSLRIGKSESPPQKPAPTINYGKIGSPCLDANMATSAEFRMLPGFGKSSVQWMQQSRCFRDEKDMSNKIHAMGPQGMNFWKDTVEFVLELGLLCVHDTELSRACEPMKIEGELVDGIWNRAEDKAFRNLIPEKPHASGELGACIVAQRLPPRRLVWNNTHGTFPESQLRFVHHVRGKGFVFLEGFSWRKELCSEAFASVNIASSGFIMASDDLGESLGVCISFETKQGETLLQYSEYNLRRKIPNFVAYKVFDPPDNKVSNADCRMDWTTVCPKTHKSTLVLNRSCQGLVDEEYEPSELVRKTCKLNDDACGAKVVTRGHMSPVFHNSWELERCRATMSYVNTFPSRQPFDSDQWATREAAVVSYLKRTRHLRKGKERGFLWIVVGTSKETDGLIPSTRQRYSEKAYVAVPSFVWTSIFDPLTRKATGWMCRNGLTEGDECFCVDKLSVHQLEERVGFKIFPQLEGADGVDLDDGSHQEFWAGLGI